MSMVSVWHGIWLLKNSTVQNGMWYIFVRFSANTTVQSSTRQKWYGFLKIVRFLNGTVYGSSRPRYTMVSLTALKAAVNLPCRALKIISVFLHNTLDYTTRIDLKRCHPGKGFQSRQGGN